MSTPENFGAWWQLHREELMHAPDELAMKRLAADCWSAGLSQLEVQLAVDDNSVIFNAVSPKIQALYHFAFQVQP